MARNLREISRGGDRARQAAARSDRAGVGEAREALERWYATSESLKELEEQHWDPVLVHAGLALAEETRARHRGGGAADLRRRAPSREAVDDLHRIGVNVGAVAAAARAHPRPARGARAVPHQYHDRPGAGRESGLDWLLFRRLDTLRRRIFGEDLALPVAPEVKRKRLPERSREALRAIIDDSVRLKFSTLAPTQAAQAVYGYVEAFCGGLQQILEHKREQFISVRDALRKEAEANKGIVALMQKLEGEVSAADTVLAALSGAEIITAPRAEEPVFAPELVEAGPRHYSAA